MKKGQNALYQCRNAIDMSWGFPPKAIRWIYLAIVKPAITYLCVVWWYALDKSFQRKISDKVQRIAFLSITGVRKSCPQVALDTMRCLIPRDMYAKRCTARSTIRLGELSC